MNENPELAKKVSPALKQSIGSTPSNRETDLAAREHLLAYRRGEQNAEEAFTAILRLVQRPVLTLLRYELGIKAVSEQDDRFQDVMIRLYRFQGSYDSEKPFLPWLYKIARNVVSSAARRRSVYVGVHQQIGEWTEKPDSPFNTKFAGMISKLSLEKAMGQLGQHDRQLLFLAYYEGCTREELSTQLKVTAGEVKYQLGRASRRLFDLLNPDRDVPIKTPVRLQPRPRSRKRKRDPSELPQEMRLRS